ncbi:MAG TPA: GNAT family protein [Propionibacteriaceae bacterium]|nr:GNAT family protein [Propionibacteriaceae bacterium]
MRSNEFGQPIGPRLPGWQPVPRPDATTLHGRYCTLELLDVDRHADQLHAAYASAPDKRDWTYLPPPGPFPSADAYRHWARGAASSTDPRHYAVIENASGRAVGTLALMRHDPANGVIEVGWVQYSPLLQRTPAATEAHFLLMRYVFDDLGYRRYEWKCDSLNDRSRRAAARLGFVYEGTFRHAVVYKGRSRDTAWFSITDTDWPQVKQALQVWLEPTNFDDELRRRRHAASPAATAPSLTDGRPASVTPSA